MLSALLVIDMQRYFLESGAKAFLGNEACQIIPNVLDLIEKFRGKNQPVIFTRHAHQKDQPTRQMGKWWNNKLPWEGDPESELISELKPRPEELLITKTHYSAFEKTELEKYLRKNNIDTVVICGVMTHLCVETTARQAFVLDFQPVIVKDGCATQSAAHQQASLLNLAHGFAYIRDSSEF
ncbi:MAG: isochorismatase family cysteine hydrolase [Pseudomonadota bacterium]